MVYTKYCERPWSSFLFVPSMLLFLVFFFNTVGNRELIFKPLTKMTQQFMWTSQFFSRSLWQSDVFRAWGSGKCSNYLLLGKIKSKNGSDHFKILFLSSPLFVEYKSLSKEITLNVAKSESETPLTYKNRFPCYSATISKRFPKVSLRVSCTSRRLHHVVSAFFCYILVAIHVTHYSL